MKQFDLYENMDKETRKAYPYFVDVQHGLIDQLKSRMVIPLTAQQKLKDSSPIPFPKNLCPIIDFEGEKFVLLAHQMSAISIQLMKKNVGSIEHYRDEIIAALDFMIIGI